MGLLAASAALALTACGGREVIGSGPLPTPAPVTPHVTNEFAVAANSQPQEIVPASDGFLYFTEEAGAIGKISTGGTLKEFPVSPAGTIPFGIVKGPDNNLWFTEKGADAIVKMAVSNDTMTGYLLGTPPSGAAHWQPTYIISGPATDTLIFAAPGANAIGQSTTGGVISSFPIPTANSGVMGLTIGPDQAVWFVENSASKIGRLDLNAPAGSQFEEFPTQTPNAGPTSIVVGVDGALWFTENNVAKLGRISTTGVVSEYPLANTGSATSLIVGADQNFYYADPVKNQIGRAVITSTFDNAVYSIPAANAAPAGMTLGPDARIYFTEPGASKVAQMIYF